MLYLNISNSTCSYCIIPESLISFMSCLDEYVYDNDKSSRKHEGNVPGMYDLKIFFERNLSESK